MTVQNEDLEILKEHLNAGRTCIGVRIGEDGRLEFIASEKSNAGRRDWIVRAGKSWPLEGELECVIAMYADRPLTIVCPADREKPPLEPSYDAAGRALTCALMWGSAVLCSIPYGSGWMVDRGLRIDNSGWQSLFLSRERLDSLIALHRQAA